MGSPETSAAPLSFRARLVAAFAAVYLIWGSTYLAILFAIETIPPFLMGGTRWIVAGGILYVLSRRGLPPPTSGEWRVAFAAGAFFILGGNGGVSWAESRVASGVASLVVATVPLWAVLLDGARPGGIWPRRGVLAGLALGFGGVAILVNPFGQAAAARIDPLGAAALVLAALSWGAGSIYVREAPRPASPWRGAAMQMLAGGALMLAAGFLSGEGERFAPARVSLKSLAAWAYLVAFGSLVGYSAYLWLLRATSPAHATTYAYVNPVVAVLLGWLFAGEALSARIAAAAAAIVAGVALVTAYRRRPEGAVPQTGFRGSPRP